MCINRLIKLRNIIATFLLIIVFSILNTNLYNKVSTITYIIVAIIQFIIIQMLAMRL